MNSSGPSSSNAMNEGGSQQYNPHLSHLSHVRISNFVSIKLSGKTNYNLWKKQIMCLLEYHDLVGYVDGTIKNHDDDDDEEDDDEEDEEEEEDEDEDDGDCDKEMTTKHKEWNKSMDTLVKGWIFATLSEHVLGSVLYFDDAYRVWKALKYNYNNEGGSQQYNPHLSHLSYVHISNFVSIKLSGETNYNLWKKQIMCLLEYHDLVGYIDMVEMTTKHKEWNKSMDTLVKGWIFGTLREHVLGYVLNLDSAFSVWEELMVSYDTSLRFIELYPKEEIEKDKEGSDHQLVKYIPLQRAIERGEWGEAQEFFNKDKATLTAKINHIGQTPLHIAVYARQNHEFVEKILEEMDPALLPTLVCNSGRTALGDAAFVGNIEAAKMLVNKNPSLLFIPEPTGFLPVLIALSGYHEKTFLYLLEVSKIYRSFSTNEGCKNPFEGIHGFQLHVYATNRGYLDAAYELICEYPKLVMSRYNNYISLSGIITNEDLYFSAARYNSYQRFIYSHVPIGKKISKNYKEIPDIDNPKKYSTKFITKCKRSCFYPLIERIYSNIWEAALLHVPHIKRLQEDKLKHKKALMILERICEEIGTLNTMTKILNQCCGDFNLAVLRDNHEVVKMIIRFFPGTIWTRFNNSLISQTMAKHRCEKVLNFLEDQAYGGFNSMLTSPNDKDGNNILHLAALLAPTEKLSVVSGAALQMQKEVQWFKRIEKCVLPSLTEERNNTNETPIMMFREEHKNLRKQGEEWMKKTADSYTITTALIITIVFAAAITVPGGNDQSTGIPIYTTNPVFIIFAISDAISLFTSTTSLLLFLSILTARYHEDDFLYKLPKRLIYGLVMLFLSVTSMMVAFGATLYIMFGREKEWILIPIAALACLPIASYVILQYPLLYELVSSTYGHGIYNKRYDQKNK